MENSKKPDIRDFVLQNALLYRTQEKILPETIYVEISMLCNDALSKPYDRETFMELAKWFKQNPPVKSEAECLRILQKKILDKCREKLSSTDFDSIETQINRLCQSLKLREWS